MNGLNRLILIVRFRVPGQALSYFMLIALLAACGTAAPPGVTPSQAVSSRLTSTPFVRPTLPPTWTATFTSTPAPPTATRTPTLTPSPTFTPAPEEVCNAFFVVSPLNAAAQAGQLHYFRQDDRIPILTNTGAVDTPVRFLAVHRLSGENQGVDIPGGTLLGIQFPVRYLPRAGLYDWSLSVQSPLYGELCKQNGSFVVVSRESTRKEEATIR